MASRAASARPSPTAREGVGAVGGDQRSHHVAGNIVGSRTSNRERSQKNIVSELRSQANLIGDGDELPTVKGSFNRLTNAPTHYGDDFTYQNHSITERRKAAKRIGYFRNLVTILRNDHAANRDAGHAIRQRGDLADGVGDRHQAQ